MVPTIFSSTENFHDAFESSLVRLLDASDRLGVFILVLANAAFEERLWSTLEGRLRIQFQRLAAIVSEREARGIALDEAEDDIQVFRQLRALGFDALSPTRFRFLDPWELQYNPLRALRPPRLQTQRVNGVSAPFDPAGFHFNLPFLQKEALWQGLLCGRKANLFYNKFPFVSLHGLLVPDPEAQSPQLLSRADHEYLWQVTQQLARFLPGIGFGYNSFGACASVNHLHFQMFQRTRPLPVSADCWLHNGGSRPYPTECHAFDNPAEAWRQLSELHRKRISYNLVMLPGTLYCLPRRRQGSLKDAVRTGGFAWYEMAGGFTCFTPEEYRGLTAGDMEGGLSQMAVEESR